jgi:chitin synthase
MALRFQNNYDFTDVPIPTSTARQAPRTGATVRRAKTLTKPERGVAPVPLITPKHAVPIAPGAPSKPQAAPSYPGSTTWRITSRIVSFWAPDFLLESLGGLKDPQVRQAWREKITLCFIIGLMCGAIGFATVGFQKVLCPASAESDSRFIRVGSTPGTLGVRGVMFDVSNAASTDAVNFQSLARADRGQDITPLFTRSAQEFSTCTNLPYRIARDDPCAAASSPLCSLPTYRENSTFQTLKLENTGFLAGYSWEQVSERPNYMVLDGTVVNLAPYFQVHNRPVPADNVDKAIRTVMALPSGGKDGTRLFMSREDLKSAMPCIKQRYIAGNIDKITPGCFVSSLVLYAGLIVILGLVFVRFVMACVFSWFMSHRLAGPPTSKDLNRSAISPAVLPEGANVSIDNRNGTAPWANSKKLSKGAPKPARSIASASSTTLINNDGLSPVMSLAQIGAELFAVCLVTCYSEGEESLRTTLDSISVTTYSDARKLLFIVADGMITGAGEKRSTPDICVSLLEADPRFGNPIPMSYQAVGSGAKGNNRAMVYAGHYSTPPFVPMFCCH